VRLRPHCRHHQGDSYYTHENDGADDGAVVVEGEKAAARNSNNVPTMPTTVPMMAVVAAVPMAMENDRVAVAASARANASHAMGAADADAAAAADDDDDDGDSRAAREGKNHLKLRIPQQDTQVRYLHYHKTMIRVYAIAGGYAAAAVAVNDDVEASYVGYPR
jgi:hypothetical protein